MKPTIFHVHEQSHEYPSTKNVLHFKGYAHGIDFTEHSTDLSVVIESIVNHFKEHPEPCLAFDGDSLASDSFTFVIPHVVQRIPHMEVWAFLRSNKEIKRFSDSWGYSGVPEIHIYAFNNVEEYSELGISALRITSSRHVICFGGGECVLTEHAQTRSLVHFRVVPVRRRNRKTGEIDHCDLDQHMERILLPL